MLNAIVSTRSPHDRWIRQWFRNVARQSSRGDRVTLAMRYIEDHFVEPLKVVDVANRVGCHTATLRREFRRRVGISMKELQTHVRVIRSITLLRSSSTKVSAIARVVGYDCEKNFYREFKRLTGVTPASIRKGSDASMHELLNKLAVAKPRPDHEDVRMR